MVAQWLSGRVGSSWSKGCGFESCTCWVSLWKKLYVAHTKKCQWPMSSMIPLSERRRHRYFIELFCKHICKIDYKGAVRVQKNIFLMFHFSYRNSETLKWTKLFLICFDASREWVTNNEKDLPGPIHSRKIGHALNSTKFCVNKVEN